MPTYFRYFGLVPYFCPDLVARAGRLCEPVVEHLPLLRAAACGQYIIAASGGQYVLAGAPSLSSPVSGL